MQITEVTTFTRANTDIAWSIDLPGDPNDPFFINANKTFTVTVDFSDDQLVKTSTRVWKNQQEFIYCHSYSNAEIDLAALTINSTPGITYSKTITTVA
jgi:hypothetical protein